MSVTDRRIIKTLKELIRKRAYDIRTRHIEVDRAWREIDSGDLHYALKGSSVHKIENDKV